MSRLDDLKTSRFGLLARMEACENGQTYAVLVKTLADVNDRIAELEPEVTTKETPLDEFTKRLRDRQTG